MARIPEIDPSTIPLGEAAIVTSNDMTELELVLPDLGDGDVPELALFLIACAVRLHSDPDFLQEQLDWLVSHHEEAPDEGLKPGELNSSNDD